MSDEPCELKVGYCIRIVRMPSGYHAPGLCMYFTAIRGSYINS